MTGITPYAVFVVIGDEDTFYAKNYLFLIILNFLALLGTEN